MANKYRSMIGQTFCRLTIVGYISGTKVKPPRWICDCSCGTKGKSIDPRCVINGHVQSCGCLGKERQEKFIKNLTKHGHARSGEISKTWKSWNAMIQRCTIPSINNYDSYGGRGIKVCDRWMDFSNFIADMGERPEGTSIDRIDNNGHYEPCNCRWATPKQQQRNTSMTRMIVVDGVLLPITEVAELYKINHRTLRGRINNGWSVEDAINTPIQKNQWRHSIKALQPQK